MENNGTTQPIAAQAYDLKGIPGLTTIQVTTAASNDKSEATLVLKNGQKATIQGLPEGVHYRITETKVGDQDIAYNADPSQGYVDGYEVMTDAQTGELTESTEAVVETFTNKYQAAGSTSLKAQKFLTQNNSQMDLTAGQFSFTLSGGSLAEPETEYNGVKPTGWPVEDTTTPGVNDVWFKALNFTEADMVGAVVNASGVRIKKVTFYIHEAAGTKEGFNYNNVTYQEDKPIVVTLVDDGKGHITATTNAEDNTVTFNNTYELKVPGALEGNKVLTGRDLKAGEFNFTARLYKTEFTVVTVDPNTNNSTTHTEPTTYPDNAEGQVHQTPVVLAGTNALATAAEQTVGSDTVLVATGTVTFPTVYYVDAGTYYYKITENTAEGDLPPGVTARKTEQQTAVTYYAKVVVPAQRDHNTTAIITYYSDAECNNALSSSADVKFENDQEVIDFTVTKSWMNESGTQITGSNYWVEFEVRRNGVVYPVTAQHIKLTSDSATHGNFVIVNGGEHDGRVKLTAGTDGWPTVQLWSLPKGTYTVTETDMTDTGDTYSTTYTVGSNTSGTCPAITAAGTALTINNNQGHEEFTDITIEKVWMSGENRYYPTEGQAKFEIYGIKTEQTTSEPTGGKTIAVQFKKDGSVLRTIENASVGGNLYIKLTGKISNLDFFTKLGTNDDSAIYQYFTDYTTGGNVQGAGGGQQYKPPFAPVDADNYQVGDDVIIQFLIPIEDVTVTSDNKPAKGMLVEFAFYGLSGWSLAEASVRGASQTVTNSPVLVRTVTMNANDRWRKTISGLPLSKTIPQTSWTYYVKEIDANAQFTVTYNPADAQDTTHSGTLTTGTVTVTNSKETIDLPVNKEWAFGSVANYWPEGITVTANVYNRDTTAGTDTEVPGKTVTLDAQHRSAVFEDLPKLAEGHTYVVKEVTVGHDADHTDADVTALGSYITLISGDLANGYTITNRKSTADLSVEKTWSNPPTGTWSATFKLQKSRVEKIAENGVLLATPVPQEENWVDVTGQDNIVIDSTTPGFRVTVENQPVLEEDNGSVYSLKYQVVETGLTIGNSSNLIESGDYVGEVIHVGDAGNSYAIVVNNQDITTNVTVRKVWEGGNAPADASVGVVIRRYKLMADEGKLTIVDDTPYSGVLEGDSVTVAYTANDKTVRLGDNMVGSGDNTVVKTVTVDGDKYTSATDTQSQNATVPLNGAATVTFTTSNFTRKTGTLTISDDYTGAPAGYSVSYRITGPYSYDETTSDTSIASLPTGEYTVAKTVTAPSGHSITSNGTDSQTVTVTTDGGTATMATTVFDANKAIYTIHIHGTDRNWNGTEYNVNWYKYYEEETNVTISIGIKENSGVNESFKVCLGDNEQGFFSPDQSCSLSFTVNSNVDITLDGITNSNAHAVNLVYTPDGVSAPASNNSTPNRSMSLSKGRSAMRALSFGATPSSAPSEVTGQVTVTTTTLTADSNSATSPTKPGKVLQMDSDWEQSVTLTRGNNWSQTLSSLPKEDEDGNEYVYYIDSVSETGIPEGTTVAITNSGNKWVVYGNASGDKVLTLTDTLPKTNISAQKIWNDNNDQAQVRPTTIRFTLHIDGVTGETKDVTSTNNWSVSWNNLELYKADGTLHTYSVTEEDVTDYSLDSVTYASGVFTLTNKYTPRPGDLSVTKTVAAGGSTTQDFHFTVTLGDNTINGTYGDMEFNGGEATFTLKHGMTKTATGLPAGVTYTVTEMPLEDYTVTYSGQTGTIPVGGTATVTVTNTPIISVSLPINATKNMAGGGAPGTFSFTLTALDGAPMPAGQTSPMTVQNSGTSITFGTIKYKQTDMSGATQVTGTGNEHKTQKTFTYTVEEVHTGATAANNYTVGGVKYDPAVYTVTVTVTYDSSTGEMAATPAYSKQIGTERPTNEPGITFTNEELVDIDATKTWKSASGADINSTITNAQVTYTLMQQVSGGNWTQVSITGLQNPVTMSVTTTADANAWKASWTNLPKYSGGQLISYKVVESAATVNTNDDITLSTAPEATATTYGTVTGHSNPTAVLNLDNTLPTTSITVKKTWSKTTTWPTNIEVGMTLKMDGTAPQTLPNYETTTQTATIWLTSADATNGKTWYNLPVYTDAGVKIVYTVEETGMRYQPAEGAAIVIAETNWKAAFTTDPSDYIGTPDTYGIVTIDNTPKETSIQVTKVWTRNGQNKTMENGASISYALYREDESTAMTVTADQLSVDHGTATVGTVSYITGSGWQTVTISKLPKYKLIVGTDTVSYEPINYYVVETGVSAPTVTTYHLNSGAEGEAAAQATNGGTITIINRDASVNIGIVKIDETTRNNTPSTKLPGASFQLYKGTTVTDNEGQQSISWNAQGEAQTTSSASGSEGTLTFSGLTEGRYKIVETQAPAGYNNLTGAIYFTISVNGVVTWTDENGTTINSQSMIEYNSTDKTFVVGNTPGVELPATGGPGTALYTATGLTLTLGAALWLVLRRRKEQQN